jgi:hypothetical protein
MKRTKEGLFSALIIMVISLFIEQLSFLSGTPSNYTNSLFIYCLSRLYSDFLKQIVGNYFESIAVFSVFLLKL